MIEKFYRFTCVDCKFKKEYPDKDTAQAVGWAIGRGGKNCYCPTCALKHRSTGCKGVKQNNVVAQLKIGEVGNA